MRALAQSSRSSNASDGQLDQADRANTPASPLARQTLTIANPTAAVASLPDVSSPNQSKSPVLAGLLSFLLIGMGQVYLGQVEKGLSMLSVALLLIMKVVLGPLGLVLLIFNVLDAFFLARKIERGQPVRKWQFFFHSK
jgi:TM2 domain-containing membrane protein YozV